SGKAVAFQARASLISERDLTLNLATGSERQKLAYVSKASLSGEFNRAISLHIEDAPTHPAACSLALTLILQRKGRVLDAMSDNLNTLRRRFNAEDRSLFDDLISARSQLAAATLSDADDAGIGQYRVRSLREKVERFEAEIGSRSLEFRLQ